MSVTMKDSFVTDKAFNVIKLFSSLAKTQNKLEYLFLLEPTLVVAPLYCKLPSLLANMNHAR